MLKCCNVTMFLYDTTLSHLDIVLLKTFTHLFIYTFTHSL